MNGLYMPSEPQMHAIVKRYRTSLGQLAVETWYREAEFQDLPRMREQQSTANGKGERNRYRTTDLELMKIGCADPSRRGRVQ
jgi:hypothetical protein